MLVFSYFKKNKDTVFKSEERYKMIYLDYAATTPISDKALEVYARVAKNFYGNTSSLHDVGSSAKQIKEASAKIIATLLNAEAKDIHFTSGASESNFLGIQALVDATSGKGKHIITTKIEHSSVVQVFKKLEQNGYTVSWLDVNEFGKIEPNEVKKSVRGDTILVSIQHINSEIGTIQPIKEIGAFLKEKNILFHTDAVQSLGKILVDVKEMGIDALSVSAHKIYGPKGVGAVWINPEREWVPFFADIHQTKRLKTGTVNVPGIAAFAATVKEGFEEMEAEF